MPCMSDSESHDLTVADMRKEINDLTRMLCQLLTLVSAMNMAGLPTDIQKWYEKHREWDKSQGR
jgi:hypothetical protein